MKKEAREKALKMFLKAKGKITNKSIADTVKVNPLTVGRWKKEHKWDRELKKQEKEAAGKPSGAVRKTAQRDKALKLFLDSGGNITNKELAQRVGVTAATIAKWKNLDNWNKLAEAAPSAADEAPAASRKPITAEPAVAEKKTPVIDIRKLASPEHLIEINDRIKMLLARDHLTPAEVAGLARAKRDVIDAVELYVSIEVNLSQFES
jgi:uncharacterized protein YjcR